MQPEAQTLSDIPDRDTVLARCRDLVPRLRERSDAAEAARECPPETVAEARAAGIPRVLQPKRYGGYGLDWSVICEVGMTLGPGCGSQAWTLSVLSDHPCLTGMFADEAQRDVWGEEPDTLVSTSYNPRGTVEKVSGGYVLNGTWKYASGVRYTGWTIVGGFVEEGGERLHHFFLVPAADRKIVDDWNAMGMAGTGSLSLTLENAFVPEHRVLDARAVREGCAPGADVNPEPLFRMPIIGFTGTALVSVTIGVAQGMVDDFADMLRRNVAEGPPRAGLEEMQGRLAEAGAEVESARLLVLDSARRNIAKLRDGGKLDESDGATTARNSAFAARLVKQAATRLFEASGGSGLALSGRLQRAFRDVYGGTAHGTLSWGRSAARYGNHVLGRPSGLPF